MELLATIYIVCLGGETADVSKIESMIKTLLGKPISRYITFNSEIVSATEASTLAQKINARKTIVWQAASKIEIFRRTMDGSDQINLLRLSELPERLKMINNEEVNFNNIEKAFAELILDQNVICINGVCISPSDIALTEKNSNEVSYPSLVSQINLTSEKLCFEILHEKGITTSHQTSLPPSLKVIVSIILNYVFYISYKVQYSHQYSLF